VVPRDAEEGDETEITGRDFELLMGQRVSFPLASSSVRANDRPGDLIPDDPSTVLPLPPLLGEMRVGRKSKAERVPVRLAARVTEIGTIELWCHSRTDERRWRLQIQVRTPDQGRASDRSTTQAGITASETVVLEQALIDRASTTIQAAFGPSPGDAGPGRLVKNLEESLEMNRDQWPPSALRALWDPLKGVADARGRSPQHESRWLNLVGYCLRPGTGFPLDESRMKALWPTWHQGVKHVKDSQCWVEWWILWRRLAAGLNRSHHEEIHRRLLPFVLAAKGSNPAKKANRPKPEPHEIGEMWRCASSLERLAPALKDPLGESLAGELAKPGAGPHVLWCLGRLGARVPLYAPVNTVVHPQRATPWVDAILGYEPAGARETSDAIFALSQMARVSGDRARDLAEPLRLRVAERLRELGANEQAVGSVLEYQEVESSQQSQALGDALPVGLRLRAEQG